MKDGYSICLNEWALDKEIKNELGLLLIISSLCAEKGFCFASNEYFAKLFDTTDVSISRKIKILESKGYISIEYVKRGCEVISRNIRLTKLLTDDYQKCKPTIIKNVKDNNTSINNTSINNKEIIKESLPFLNQETKDSYQIFKDMRKKMRKPIANDEKMFEKLMQLSNGNENLMKEILDQSIVNGWQGLFSLKKERMEFQRITSNEIPKVEISADDINAELNEILKRR